MVEVPWNRAARAEVKLMVSWMRTADNPQRRRSNLSAPQAGSVNVKTGKPLLRAGYAASTINHAVTVVAGFYDYHRCHGRGPLINPVPASGDRARLSQRAGACQMVCVR